jgi:hypothetical protein
MRAELTGGPIPNPSRDTHGLRLDELIRAAMRDADLYRALMRYVMVLRDAPDLADPSLVEQVRRRMPAESPSAPPEGPTRAELVQILAGSY